ncbi:MAG: flagellar protein FliS [Lachnospiraceae bacterium]|nr:flagellar protein FliS [Lachnospiraceae bacterium]
MTDELKKEYTLRISQANKTTLIVILYEMLLIYVDEAKKALAEDEEKRFQEEIRKARGCLKELMNSLNFDYALAGNLLSLYVYVSKELVDASLHKKAEPLEHVIGVIGELYTAYVQLAEQDTSPPVMGNSQTVYAGLTYGRSQLTESMADQGASRGFWA